MPSLLVSIITASLMLVNSFVLTASIEELPTELLLKITESLDGPDFESFRTSSRRMLYTLPNMRDQLLDHIRRDGLEFSIDSGVLCADCAPSRTTSALRTFLSDYGRICPDSGLLIDAAIAFLHSPLFPLSRRPYNKADHPNSVKNLIHLLGLENENELLSILMGMIMRITGMGLNERQIYQRIKVLAEKTEFLSNHFISSKPGRHYCMFYCCNDHQIEECSMRTRTITLDSCRKLLAALSLFQDNSDPSVAAFKLLLMKHFPAIRSEPFLLKVLSDVVDNNYEDQGAGTDVIVNAIVSIWTMAQDEWSPEGRANFMKLVLTSAGEMIPDDAVLLILKLCFPELLRNGIITRVPRKHALYQILRGPCLAQKRPKLSSILVESNEAADCQELAENLKSLILKSSVFEMTAAKQILQSSWTHLKLDQQKLAFLIASFTIMQLKFQFQYLEKGRFELLFLNLLVIVLADFGGFDVIAAFMLSLMPVLFVHYRLQSSNDPVKFHQIRDNVDAGYNRLNKPFI